MKADFKVKDIEREQLRGIALYYDEEATGLATKDDVARYLENHMQAALEEAANIARRHGKRRHT